MEKYAELEGQAVALASILANPGKGRVHEDLPPDHSVPWPDHLQIKTTRKLENRDNTRRDIISKTAGTADDQHGSMAAHFAAMRDAAATSRMPSQMPDLHAVAVAEAVVVPVKLSKEELDARTRCMQAVRTAHRSFDSAVLDYKMAHQSGSQNEFVAENLLLRLSQHIDTCAAHDKDLVAADVTYRKTQIVDITAMKTLIQSMHDDMAKAKSIAKKVNAILLDDNA